MEEGEDGELKAGGGGWGISEAKSLEEGRVQIFCIPVWSKEPVIVFSQADNKIAGQIQCLFTPSFSFFPASVPA